MSFVKDHSIEKLHSMPLEVLRNLDIRSKDEEIILQAVVSEKMKSAPIGSMPQLTPEEQKLLDSPQLTPEKEKEIQARLDERRAKYRSIVVGEKTPSIEKLQIENKDITGINPVPSEIQKEFSLEKKFCEFCTSKGVKHKKDCTRI